MGYEEFGDGRLLDVLGQVGKRCIAVVNCHCFHSCAIGLGDGLLFAATGRIGAIARTAIKDALDGNDTCFGGERGQVCADVAWSSLGELPEIDVARETQLGAEYFENPACRLKLDRVVDKTKQINKKLAVLDLLVTARPSQSHGQTCPPVAAQDPKNQAGSSRR